MPSNGEEFYLVQKLPPYVFAVINEMCAKSRAAGIDVIDLGMGNPDGATPKVVVQKLIEAARQPSHHRYSQSRGVPALRKAIVDRYQRNFGVELDPNTEAVVTIGAKEGLAHLLMAMLTPGDSVALPNPAYPIHQYGVVMAHGETQLLAMPDAAGFLENLKALYASDAPKPKALLISFPHNPTCVCVDLEFFREIIALAKQHGTYVIHDLAYADFGFDGYQPPSILQVEGAKDIAVEFFSMSKSYNMAGWRVGFCLGNAKLVAALTRIKSYLDYGTFEPIQIAAAAALELCEAEPPKIRAVYQKRRDVIVKGLNKAGWPVEKPRGSMFLWAQIPEGYRHMTSLDFSKLLLEKSHVAVSPGIGFGPMGEGYVRFAFVDTHQRMKEATERIGEFLRGEKPAVVETGAVEETPAEPVVV